MIASSRPGVSRSIKKKMAGRHILVRVDDHRWQREIPRVVSFCRATVAEVLTRSPRLASELSIMLTDDNTIRGLNRQYRNRDTATNVLSFALAPEAAQTGQSATLGDIVLGFDTVCREARAQGKSFANHSRHLLVHGTLHLLGHDHEGAVESETMERVEIEVLAAFGVGNPYILADDSGSLREKGR